MKYYLSFLLFLGTVSMMAQSFVVKGPANPKPYEKTAIQEMSDYLAKRIGEHKLVIGGKTPVTFQIGDTDLAKQQKCLSTELEDERWVIRSVGNQILINGGGARGALYATYHFLEDFCDIHWWSDYEEYVPAKSSLTLPDLNATGKPVFLYRDIYRSSMGPNNNRTAIRVRLNRNGGEGLALLPLELGGSFAYGNPGHCHTFDKYIPFAKYGKEHPEYFSLIDGKRVGGQTKGQLCLTNPALKEMFLTQLLAYIESDKAEAAKKNLPPPRIYDVSMNDNNFRCSCDKCKAEEEKYNPSGLYLNFVNWIAAEVSKKHPGLYISTLAYFFSEPPPLGGVRAADNVIVKLCDTKTNQAASILEPENKVFYDFLTQWKHHAKNLFVWDYAITFTGGVTGFPFASEFHYGDLYRTYHENNVTGIFWEHERPHCADFYELKFFLETKLFEDPYQDVNALIDLFMDRYYGTAAKPLLEYRKGVDAARKKNGGFVNWFPAAGAFSFITNQDIMNFQALFDAAEKAVANDKVRFGRVRHARVGLDRLTCLRNKPIFYHGTGRKSVAIPEQIGKEALKRIKESRNDWIKGWINNEPLLKQYDTEFEALNFNIQKLPPPPELAGHNFYDFYAVHLQSHDKNNVVLVDDPESRTGKAMRTDVDSNAMKRYDLPFIFGLYDTQNRRGAGSTTFAKPIGKGYNWYKMPTPFHTPRNGYLFATRSWTTQLPTSDAEIADKDFNIWLSVKFTGPKFFEGSTDKNYIYIDRIVLIEPEKKN